MCGVLLGLVAPQAAAARLQAARVQAQAGSAWALTPMQLPRQADLATWETVRGAFPDVLLSVPTPWVELVAALDQWWDADVAAWWDGDAAQPWRTLWRTLAVLRAGRLLYPPQTGAGWMQTRPRTIPFTDPVTAPCSVITQAWAPAPLCCCHLGVPLDGPLRTARRLLWMTLLDTWMSVVATMPPEHWLVIEVDPDAQHGDAVID